MYFKPTQVNIGSMKLNAMGKGCRTSLSQTLQTDMNNRMKRNAGFGEDNSDGSVYINPLQGLDDSDLIDMVNVLNRRKK